MEVVYWILLPFVVASGSALLGSILMKARMEVALGREREALVEAKSAIAQFHKTMEEKIKTAASEARRNAMDEFLNDLHVEERHYLREKTSPSTRRKYLVLQERLYFRKIPLSHWVEHEMPVEEASDLEELARSISSFAGGSQPLTDNSRVRKLLR